MKMRNKIAALALCGAMTAAALPVCPVQAADSLTYEFEDGKATIFDLIAKANIAQSNNGAGGGIGIRRDKILVMREVDGVLNSDYISLLSKDILFSPYYYLQQNDVIYVWPSQTAIRGSNRIVDFWLSRLSIVTTAVSLVTLVVTLFSKKQS